MNVDFTCSSAILAPIGGSSIAVPGSSYSIHNIIVVAAVQIVVFVVAN